MEPLIALLLLQQIYWQSGWRAPSHPRAHNGCYIGYKGPCLVRPVQPNSYCSYAHDDFSVWPCQGACQGLPMWISWSWCQVDRLLSLVTGGGFSGQAYSKVVSRLLQNVSLCCVDYCAYLLYRGVFHTQRTYCSAPK